jgi:hypothetical protein
MYVTKQVFLLPSDSETDAGNEPGVPQIEVTPEMIEAGVEIYLQWCPDSGTGDRTDQKMVAEIFVAMTAAKLGLKLLPFD